MPGNDPPRMHDLEIFARALENILRKLIRFLVGRISLVKLSEMIRTIYVQEAERKLKLERPTKSVSLTRLAVLTGIDTRTLTKVRNSEEFSGPLYKTRRFLREMTPEGCILDVWSSDNRFLNPETGRPRPLQLSGGENSFEQLVNEAVSSRGVTAQSLLETLASNGAIRLDEHSGEVELVEAFFGPFKSGDAISALDVGLSFVVRQMETVFHNYAAIIRGDRTYYDRMWFTHHLNPKDSLRLQKDVNAILEGAHRQVRDLLSSVEEKFASERHLVAGVGMYYIEFSPGADD